MTRADYEAALPHVAILVNRRRSNAPEDAAVATLDHLARRVPKGRRLSFGRGGLRGPGSHYSDSDSSLPP